MDTIARKTPDPLPLAGWQALSPAEVAREVHQRVAALPPALRQAALAYLRPEQELAVAVAACPDGTPLRGIPYLLKDLYDVAGLPTNAGSIFLASVRPTLGESAMVQRLRKLGAVFAGKTHLVEFASGLTGENPHYGDCPHPRFPNRLSGGSSSGSAALVGAGVVPLAIGTDTGGSVRVPAAYCGVYGFRLTPGDELIRDAFPLSPTCDTAGWFTANAGDMLTVWRAFTGGSATTETPHGCSLAGQRLLEGIAPDVAAACQSAAARFTQPADIATADELVAVWQDAVDAYIIIVMCEANAVHRNWLAPYREHYDPVIWQRFTDAGRYPAEKIAAARAALVRNRETWQRFFQRYDYLVMPCAPFPALTKAECTPEARRAMLTFTAPASLGGLPCLTIPVPLPSGLTAGLQIIAREAASPVFNWALVHS